MKYVLLCISGMCPLIVSDGLVNLAVNSNASNPIQSTNVTIGITAEYASTLISVLFTSSTENWSE